MKTTKEKKIIDELVKSTYTYVSGRIDYDLYKKINEFRKKQGISWNLLLTVCFERILDEIQDKKI